MTTKTNSLRSRLVWLAVAFALILGTRFLSTGQTGATTPAILFNGWGLSPVGNPIELPGDMPARIVPTADSRFLIVNSVGFNEHGVFVIDLAKASVVQQVDLAKSWIGLGLAADGRLLIASGGGPMPPEPTYWGVRLGIPPAARERLSFPIYLLDWAGGQLSFRKGVPLPKAENPFIAGVAAGPDGSVLVADLRNNQVLRLSAGNMDVAATASVGSRPYEVALSPDGKVAAVSNMGEDSVSLLNAQTLREIQRIRVGRFPNELAYARDGRLFVANGGSNSVTVIRGGRLIETVEVSLRASSKVGSTTNAIAVNPQGTLLFAANAGNNNVAVMDISDPEKSVVLGFIPTAWYPSALASSPDGRTLYIGIGKGSKSGRNVPYAAPPPRLGRTPENLLDNPKRNATQYSYIAGTLRGFVYALPIPDRKELARLTKMVQRNTPAAGAAAERRQEEIRRSVFPQIKHILYVIRENRTYDQVFGDLPQGNGEPRYVLFGRSVTPNAHRLAETFALLDNFYADGEVSQDGHAWCDSAYATDFLQKAWQYSYSGRGKIPDEGGRLSASPGGTIWQLAGSRGLDFRNYGEGSARPSEAWKSFKPGFFEARDTHKAAAFLQDLAQAEKSGNWPRLMVMSLPTDHTQGLLPGAYSPTADVADNDLALGRIVEAISNSRFWKETAIFVVEDDAQDGPDHVDAHRTVGLVVSPFLRRGFVDHTRYTQVSILRTIEEILDLPSMSQFDEAATDFANLFTTQPNLEKYKAITPGVDMQARNPREGPGARASLKLDFSELDRADSRELNRILWQAIRPGEDEPVSVHPSIPQNSK